MGGILTKSEKILILCTAVFLLVLGGAFLVFRLAALESFGVAYLTPFASNAGRQREGHTVLRQPLPKVKRRPDYLKVKNRRNQG